MFFFSFNMLFYTFFNIMDDNEMEKAAQAVKEN